MVQKHISIVVSFSRTSDFHIIYITYRVTAGKSFSLWEWTEYGRVILIATSNRSVLSISV